MSVGSKVKPSSQSVKAAKLKEEQELLLKQRRAQDDVQEETNDEDETKVYEDDGETQD